MSIFILHSDGFHVQILSIQSSFIDTGNRVEEVIILLLHTLVLFLAVCKLTSFWWVFFF